MNDHFLTYWFRGLDHSLSELDNRSIDTLMTHCGQACSDSYTKPLYREEYRASASLDDFIARLNGKFDEMTMKRISPEEIEVIYTRCACDLVQKGYIKNPKVCLCSLKSLQYNWEAVLGKGNVVCRLENSILNGKEHCRFVIKIISQGE